MIDETAPSSRAVMGGKMDFTIDGTYQPYAYLVLLKVSLFLLQRPDHLRHRSIHRGASATANVTIDFYCALTALIAHALSWGTWGLAIYVGYRFGIHVGVLFFVLGFVGGTLLSLVVPVGFVADISAHLVSLFATPYLLIMLLRSVGTI